MGSAATALNSFANNGKGGFVLIGAGLALVDVVDFINIATLYAFLDFTKPGNLESIFKDLEDSLQISIFPMINGSLPFS